MYLVQGFDRSITKQLREADELQQASRTPSGLLSASMLCEPLQWQVLKTLGIGSRVVDDYVLRKFARGKDTEEWYLTKLGAGVVKRQEKVTYNGAIGFYDALVDTGAYGGKFGVLPLEVKSVTNAKFKHLETRREPDKNHLIQGAFYGLGLGCEHFALTYIASDDYRTLTWIFETKDFKDEIDSIISTYGQQMAWGAVPVFKPIYAWQAKLEYNKFPDWADLDEKAIKLALDSFYPNAWKDYYAKPGNKTQN